VLAEWSPLGFSSTHGCVLAILDSHHRVSLWERNGIGTSDSWLPVTLTHIFALQSTNSRSLILPMNLSG